MNDGGLQVHGVWGKLETTYAIDLRLRMAHIVARNNRVAILMPDKAQGFLRELPLAVGNRKKKHEHRYTWWQSAGLEFVARICCATTHVERSHTTAPRTTVILRQYLDHDITSTIAP